MLGNTFAPRAINIAGAICMPDNVTGQGRREQCEDQEREQKHGLDQDQDTPDKIMRCKFHVIICKVSRATEGRTEELYVLGRRVKGLLRGHWDVKCELRAVSGEMRDALAKMMLMKSELARNLHARNCNVFMRA